MDYVETNDKLKKYFADLMIAEVSAVCGITP